MVVEFTEEELIILVEAISLYKMSFDQTRIAYNELKKDTLKQNELDIYESELNIATEIDKALGGICNKLNISEDDIYQTL